MLVRKKSLVDKIYSALKEDIILVRFNVGDMLTEAMLAERFKVSKTPVREALNRLSLDGYVEILPHKGYSISSISFSDIHNLFQLRNIFEVGIMDEVIAKMVPDRLKKLESIANVHFDVMDENSFKEYLEINFKFHSLLIETANNSLLSAYYHNVLDKLSRVLLIDFKRSKKSVVTKEHHELLEAIKGRNVTAAKKIAGEHIEKARQRIINL